MNARPHIQAARFFHEHAGYSWNEAKGETAAQGRYRCARALARAERLAHAAGYSFQWEYDGMDSSEWTDEKPSWPTWQCVMRDASGDMLESLCGIDFGRDGSPWSDPYRRVVEAELASDHYHANP